MKHLIAINKETKTMKELWDSLEIDLHKKNLNEAMQIVEKSIEKFKLHSKSLVFITGKGLHSRNKQPVIKPELEGYLKRNGFWWSHPKTPSGLTNTGRYTIKTFAEYLD